MSYTCLVRVSSCSIFDLGQRLFHRCQRQGFMLPQSPSWQQAKASLIITQAVLESEVP